MRPLLLTVLWLFPITFLSSGRDFASAKVVDASPEPSTAAFCRASRSFARSVTWSFLPEFTSEREYIITLLGKAAGVNGNFELTFNPASGANARPASATMGIVQCGGRDDSAALIAASKASNGQWVVIADGQTCAASDITIPNLRIENGGLLKPANGQKITIGRLDAGPYRVFTNAIATQEVVSLAASNTAYPQWWGGVPDGATANQTYIRAALNSGAKRVELSAGDWKITAPIIWTNTFVTLHGASTLGTYISAGAGVPAMIKFEGPVNPGAGGYQIENIRFNGFSGTNFNGYAIDASVNTFIDSSIRNCWFGLSSSAQGAFNGKAVSAHFDDNSLELGKNTLHFTLASSLRISGNYFWNCYFSIIDFDNPRTGQFNEIQITNNVIDFHQVGTAIRAQNVQNLTISDLIYAPSDVIPAADLSWTPTVFDFDNSHVLLSNIREAGLLAYLDSDSAHRGTAYPKIKYGLKAANGSIVSISNSSFSFPQYGLHVTGSITLQASQLDIDQAGADGIYMNNATGLISLDHVKIVKPAGTWISQVGTTTADTYVRNSEFYNARWSGAAGHGFLLTTSGNVEFNNNVIARDNERSAVSDFIEATLSDGKAFFDNNRFISSVAPGGHLFSPRSTGYRAGPNRGMATIYFAAAMPTSGPYVAGDVVMKTNPVEAGARGSRYIIIGWKRFTTGGTHVLNTDWFEMRTFTGN